MIPFLDIGLKLIDKLIPDPAAKQQAQLDLLKLTQAGEFKEIDASIELARQQTEINKADAESGSAFRGGWRPMTGYVCVAGLAYQFLGQPLLAWASGIWGIPVPPSLDMGDLFTILGGMPAPKKGGK